jgi:hypothetical protein
MRSRNWLLFASAVAFVILCLAIGGFVAGWWRVSTMAVMLCLAGLLKLYLLVTARCPSCSKSVFVKEGLPLNSLGGRLTMAFLPFPEAHCSRCRTRLD